MLTSANNANQSQDGTTICMTRYSLSPPCTGQADLSTTALLSFDPGNNASNSTGPTIPSLRQAQEEVDDSIWFLPQMQHVVSKLGITPFEHE